ncbi:hypothetical protein P9112_002413 [Eukaryota sp. TZLM1-RC]
MASTAAPSVNLNSNNTIKAASSKPLMATVSGVRGIVNESLTAPVAYSYVSAFASLKRNSAIIVGRDSRVSGPELYKTVLVALREHDIDVINLDIVPTPTVQLMVTKYKAAGGIVITASHNPIEWNGLKFVDSDGLFCSPSFCKELYAKATDILSNNPSLPSPTTGSVREDPSAINQHLDSIFSLSCVNPRAVQSRKFKVALDTVNGAGGPIMEQLLTRLGCSVFSLNLEPTGLFAHPPEPIPEHLSQLSNAVISNQCDLGIATDPDVDRCVLVGNDGKPLGEEFTLVMALYRFLMVSQSAQSTVIVKNCSTSYLVDIVAEQHGFSVKEAAVGEINVAKMMQETGSLFGGEGNGGVMLSDCHIGRDAPVAACLVLSCLAEFDGSINELRDSLPRFDMVKTKLPVDASLLSNMDILKDQMINLFSHDVNVSTIDGVKISSTEKGSSMWWVHLRASNTEPIMRIIAEAGKDSVYSIDQLVGFVRSVL